MGDFEYYWVRPHSASDEWEPARDDGGGYFLLTGTEMPGKPHQVGPKIEPPKVEVGRLQFPNPTSTR